MNLEQGEELEEEPGQAELLREEGGAGWRGARRRRQARPRRRFQARLARAAASSLRSHAPPSCAPRPPVRPAAGQGGSRRRGEASSREGAARTELEVAGPGEGGGVRGL